jgi:hypothetical protein
VLISCYVIGEGDDPPMHDLNQVAEDEDWDEFEGIDDADLTPQQLIQKKKRAQNVSILDEPKILSTPYQLMINVVHGQSLLKDMNSFISCRVQNYVMCTEATTKTSEPKWNSRLQFPISLPLLNDKIIIKMWNKKNFATDTFYANVPENPFYENKFHINYLQSTGGNMPFTYINLYGIPEHERDGWWKSKFKSKKKIRWAEGTDYLGRVLISMVLLSHEKPEQKRGNLDGCNEPDAASYHLQFYNYKMDLNEDFEEIFINIKFADGCIKSKRPKIDQNAMKNAQSGGQGKSPKVKAQSFLWYWPESKWKSKSDENINSLKDLAGAPDIIISLCKGKAEDFVDKDPLDRIGYARIPANAEFLTKDVPQWLRFKSIQNNYDDCSPGSLLCNVKLIRMEEDTKIPQSIKVRMGSESKQTVLIHCWGCIGLAPDQESRKIKASVQIEFLSKSSDPDEFIANEQSRNPVIDKKWSFCKEMPDNLQFLSQIHVSVVNKAEDAPGRGIFGMYSRGEIGTCSINPGDLIDSDTS